MDFKYGSDCFGSRSLLHAIIIFNIGLTLRHHRTIHGSRLGGTFACIFSVILSHHFHCMKVSRQQRSRSCFLILFRLTENLTAQLRHQNCAVVP